ncbi:MULTISPECIES: hypothetical protein [Clostridia]|uniref:hypothetical protein n=1 Tax=Clostridia TaxID=186801 RepID=UPI001D51844E|nr:MULTISPECIES: hypothetical protein [Clostridia]MBS5595812.1 hypothetical protein [Peptostreptococcus sp.]MDK8278262.1 hypothetical protein [Peptostreptococcus anaerobius]MDU1175690.1 hypothetical protein [Peptostreptococcus anaerobius]MDU1232150.1 hypothetical protein [Clostridium sp.]MDU1233607.1 hypothetical protein [Peptostreptococcus anaerobius]
MSRIKGIQVILIDKESTRMDPFGNEIYEEKEIKVDNVLVAPTSSDDMVSQLNISGKKVIYSLAIPKGDTNIWEDREVIFFGQRWKTLNFVTQGIEDMIPLDWNKKVLVERYG